MGALDARPARGRASSERAVLFEAVGVGAAARLPDVQRLAVPPVVSAIVVEGRAARSGALALASSKIGAERAEVGVTVDA